MKRTVQGVGALSLALGMCWLVGCQTMGPVEEERETILQRLNGYKAYADGKTYADGKAYADGYDYLKNLTVLLRNRAFLEQQRSAWCVSWSEARINELMEQTRARLLKKDVAGARAYVYGFGIVGIPEVDNAVAVVKVQILNSWINPRECADILARNKSAFESLVEKGDLDGAEAFLKKEKEPAVVAYVATIDQSLEAIAQEAQRLDVPTAAGAALAANRRTAYQDYFGGRMSDYLPFEPNDVGGKKARDYTRLQALLAVLAERLKSQDMPEADADEECAALGASIESLVKGLDTVRKSAGTLTTQELNARVHAWYDVSRAQLKEMRRLQLAMKVAWEELVKQFRRMLAQQAALEALGPFDPDAAVALFTEAIQTASPEVARIYGDAARVLRLMKRDVALGDEEKSALLVAAACLDRDELVRRMLTLGANANAVSRLDSDKVPALLWAVRMESDAAFAELLAGDANPEGMDAQGWTALMDAVRFGRERMVRMLLDRGVRVDAQDAQGRTALHLAAARGDTGVMRMLLEAGAPIDALNGEKESPCAVALKANCLNAVRLLVVAQCDLKAVPDALDLAVKTKDVDTVKYVVETWKIADAAVLTRGVARAAREGSCACVRYLVEVGGAVEDIQLDLAVWSGNLETVKYFVERGCDVQKVRATATPEVEAYLKSQGRQ